MFSRHNMHWTTLEYEHRHDYMVCNTINEKKGNMKPNNKMKKEDGVIALRELGFTMEEINGFVRTEMRRRESVKHAARRLKAIQIVKKMEVE